MNLNNNSGSTTEKNTGNKSQNMFSDTPLSKSFTFKCQTLLKILKVRPKFADFDGNITAFSLHHFAHVGLCSVLTVLPLQFGNFFELLFDLFLLFTNGGKILTSIQVP